MKKVTVKAYAKLNLTLCITGIKDGYHELDSIVCTVNLCDKITVKKSNTSDFRVTMRGKNSESIPPNQNNALKAAMLFKERFSLGGGEIFIKKAIPIGAGLGGSSADAAGVLNALAKLYDVKDGAILKELADECGSDTGYMLCGGYARLSGRGEKIKKSNVGLKLHILLAVPSEGVSTAQCYKKFDELNVEIKNSDLAQAALERGDLRGLCERLSNDLLTPAKGLCGAIEREISLLKTMSPLAVNMTGSGSGVYAVFESRKKLDKAIKLYGGNAEIYKLITR